MNILGISASARKGRMVEQTVTNIVEKLNGENQIISLSGKKINGCTGCTACALDNICKQKDDWNEIGDALKWADVIVFGAPNYYGTINAIGHAVLERTFSFRHGGAFNLEGKQGIIVSTTRGSAIGDDPVKQIIDKFMKSNKMNILGHVAVEGYDQCYTCGIGNYCVHGNVVRHHGVLDKIEQHHLPKELCEQENAINQIDLLIKNLQSTYPNLVL